MMLPQIDSRDKKMLLQELTNEKVLNTELEVILESIYDEVYVTDANGTTLLVNSACKRLYGLDPEELIGKNVNYLSNIGIFSPPLTPKVVQEKKTMSEIQVTRTGKEVIVTANPVFDKEGNVIKVVSITRDITEINQLRKELVNTRNLIRQYKDQLITEQAIVDNSHQIIYRSKTMRNVIELAEKIAAYDSNVLIIGDSGVGKGILAKYIHKNSNRKDGPFITVNCGAIPENLIESELFGYEKGAFTGANREGKIGLFETANKGTLFLDEISELPLSMQVKLLAAIQEKTITRVGGNKQINLDFRLIAAANRSLEDLVKRDLFRKDLYYRLNVIPIFIPPLRERKEDIVHLIYHFLDHFAKLYNKKLSMSSSALDLLIEYSWPGNVRELENLIERLVVTVDDYEISEQHLPAYVKNTKHEIEDGSLPNSLKELKDKMAAMEKEIIMQAYKELGSTYKVAKQLNLSQSSVARKIRNYRME